MNDEEIRDNAVKAFKSAVKKVVERHRREGTRMAVWEDGKVVLKHPKPKKVKA